MQCLELTLKAGVIISHLPTIGKPRFLGRRCEACAVGIEQNLPTGLTLPTSARLEKWNLSSRKDAYSSIKSVSVREI